MPLPLRLVSSEMAHSSRPLRSGALGASLIYIASALLTLNLLGWVVFGMPLKLVPAWGALWCVGILVHAVEPAKAMRRVARR